MLDYIKFLAAYEKGLDDGFFRGEECSDSSEWSDFESASYKRGYDHGIWMFCEMQEAEECPTDDSRSYGPQGANK